jgi:transcriptional regulator with XRE-family HTH domain
MQVRKKPMGKYEKNDLLREARKGRGWTREELAKKMGTGEQTVKSWENGDRNPGLRSRRHLCQLFDMTAAQLGLDPQGAKNPRQKEGQAAGTLLAHGEPEQDAPQQLRPEEEQVTDTLLAHDEREQAVPQQPRHEEGGRAGTFVAHDPNRRRMLRRVQTRWINGVLDYSKAWYQGALIPLRLQECSSAVVNPWSTIAQESNLPSRSLSSETRILDVYDEADGGLLILGEPGAGKTTLLLSLARDLIKRASLDETHPMPVVFHLSSWAEKRSSFPLWLVDELQVKYQVPRKLAQIWVSENRILPLLDGLDEVANEYRLQCMQVINAYRREQGFVPMVVCSRASEYLALNAHLALNNAVTIEPLGWEEIESYISQAGESLQGVQIALKSDPGLQEMASTPLMLHIIAQTFSVTSIDTILSVQDAATQRAMIFEKYVDIVLKRRGPANHYPPEQTVHWLSWLALHLQKHHQTEFYLERMQPDWLPDDRARGRYRNTIIRFVFGINCCALSGLFACFRGDSDATKPGLFFWLGAGGKGNEILEWMRPGLGGGLAGAGSLGFLVTVLTSLIVLIINMRKLPTLSLKTVQGGLLNGLRNGLLVGGPVMVLSGIIFTLSNGISTGLYRGVGTGVYAALLIFLTTGLIATLRSCSEQHHRARPAVVDRIVNGIVFSLCGMTTFVCIYVVQAGEIALAIKYGTIIGVYNMTFAFSDSMDLIRGLGTTIVPAETMTWSWHSVGSNLKANIYHAVLIALFVLGITVVVLTCVSSMYYGPEYGVRYGLIYGLITGLVIGFTTVLTQVLTSGWSSSMLPKDQQTHPNEGITRSARNSLFAAFLSGPIGGIVSGIATAFAFKVAGGLAGWQILGVGFALVFGIEFALQIVLAYGGIAVIEHYILRWYLWRYGNMPLNYIFFLNYAVERIFLRKIGGGYMFSHRLLLDYFASLWGRERLRGR